MIVVPALAGAETTRGGARDALVNRVLRGSREITPVTEIVAREAGRLIAAANITHATVDALIVTEAVLHGPSVVLTGDLADSTALAANHPHVLVHGV